MLIKYLFCQFLLGTDGTALKDMLFFLLEEAYLLIECSLDTETRKHTSSIVLGKSNAREPRVILVDTSLGRIVIHKYVFRN